MCNPKRCGAAFFLCFLLACGWVKAASSSDRDELSAALLRAERDGSSEFMVNVWQTGDGLPINVVEELQQCESGFLWLGTSHGLVRFDGLGFRSYFTVPSGARYGSRFGPMEVDAEGRLWLAADQVGLILLDQGKFVDVQKDGPLLRARVESLCSDGAGRLMWVEANGGCGWLSKDEPWNGKRFVEAVPSGSEWMRDFEGNMWLRLPRSLRLFRSGEFTEAEPAGGPTLEATPCLAGGLWVAQAGRLSWLATNGVTHPVCRFPWLGAGTRVTKMLEDRSGVLWIGTASQGLYCFRKGEFKQVVPTASAILCLLEDREENVWAGTRGGGLVRVRPRQFFVHDLRTGLANEFVQSLCQDTEGRVWAASTEGGFGWWGLDFEVGSRTNTPGSPLAARWHEVGPPLGGARVDVLSVCPARDGGVWFSTSGREVWRWKNGLISRVQIDHGVHGRDAGVAELREPAVDLLEARDGSLWMVTDNSGVYRFVNGALFSYGQRDGLPSTLVRRLVEDEKGLIWVGDWCGGVSQFREDAWHVVRAPSGHADAVRSMALADGVLWIGTSAGGVLRLKEGKTSRLSVASGLPNACIEQLVFGPDGDLWGCTPHQLFRISLLEANAVLDGKLERIRASTYGRGDGLPDTSFASWSDPRVWRTPGGELWFASANGAIRFAPGNLPQGRPPKVEFERFLVDGAPVPGRALLGLRPSDGRIDFTWTAPCMSAPHQVRFKYQLTGVDSDWVQAGTARSATYASLPAGSHSFRVMASSPGGEWGRGIAVADVVVNPFFWQSSWFIAAATAVGAGGGVWAWRRATVARLRRNLERLQQQHAIDQERTRIARDIHDELGANLTSIGLLSDIGQRHKGNPEALSRDLTQISATARESVAAMDAIVWALNPRNDSVDHFANYVAQFTRDFFQPTGIRTRLELPANLPSQRMPTEMRHELFLIVKEAFNNVVRHAEATEVRVELGCDAKELKLVVADDGRGMPPEPGGEGRDGLGNLRERIARLGGRLEIGNDADLAVHGRGLGTKLSFVLPVSKVEEN